MSCHSGHPHDRRGAPRNSTVTGFKPGKPSLWSSERWATTIERMLPEAGKASSPVHAEAICPLRSTKRFGVGTSCGDSPSANHRESAFETGFPAPLLGQRKRQFSSRTTMFRPDSRARLASGLTRNRPQLVRWEVVGAEVVQFISRLNRSCSRARAMLDGSSTRHLSPLAVSINCTNFFSCVVCHDWCTATRRIELQIDDLRRILTKWNGICLEQSLGK